jgi:hypothetical protein
VRVAQSPELISEATIDLHQESYPEKKDGSPGFLRIELRQEEMMGSMPMTNMMGMMQMEMFRGRLIVE